MFELLGMAFGFWLIYALISSFTKHEIGLITTFVLGITAGISVCIARGNCMALIGTILAAVCIIFIIPIQVKSSKKANLKKENDEDKNKKEQ